MSNEERITYFSKHIESIKTKEAKEEIERKKGVDIPNEKRLNLIFLYYF